MSRWDKKQPPKKYTTGKRVMEAIAELSKSDDGFALRISEHVQWMEAKRYAMSTIERTERSLVSFATWAEKRGVEKPGQVTRPMLERYAQHLYEAATERTGMPLEARGQFNVLSSLRVFFRWLARRNFVLYSPANDLELPKLGFRLPKGVLTHAETERVLSQPDASTATGIRDRSILETFYSTGIRRTELTQLELGDLDLSRGTLMVRQGKGRRDRMVPIGERAEDWIERYLSDARPVLAVDASERALYITAYGKAMSSGSLTHRVKEYVKAAEVGKEGSCHLFRHTMATQMLERGADVRIIQEILGHQKLETTNIYTHVSIAHLKEVHERTHPTSRRGPLSASAGVEPSTGDRDG